MAFSLLKLTSSIPTRASACALLVVPTACALFLMSVARPVAPHGMPPLALDVQASATAMARDAEAAAGLRDSGTVATLDALLHEYGVAQRELFEPEDVYRRRRIELQNGLRQLVDEQGTGAVAALRARATLRMVAALAGDLPQDAIAGVMGTFANQLQRHHMLVGQRIVAPQLAVRSLYKARWNLVHGLRNDEGLVEVEAQALHGWLGMYGTALEANARLQALKTYADAGGRDALEAQGIVLFGAGDYRLSALALVEAHDADPGHFRLENFALGARLAAGMD